MKTLIINNPATGYRERDDDFQRTLAFLHERGWEVVGVEQTHGRGDATTYARRAVAQGCQAVFVAGGDGTNAQAVDGLVGTDTALGILPAGTGNVMARQLGLPVPGSMHPRPLLESAWLLLDGQVRPVDVGRVRPVKGEGPAHHFLCWSGIGFDAQVNIAVEQEPERKQRLRVGAFVVAAFLTLRTFAGMPAIVRVDGRRVSRRMIMLVANNIQLYGIFFKMAPHAVLDDGRLDIYCFQGRGPGRTLLHALRLFFSRHLQDPKVDIYRANHVEVRTGRPLPVHVDGEPIGCTPVVIEAVPRALRLIVPPTAPASLFTNGIGLTPPESTWEWMMRMAKDAQMAFKAGLE
jgi:YegS/Rv2252/BmrU family lipid kinase